MEEQGDPLIERGEIYEHKTHGGVRVIGIWRDASSIDGVGNIDDADVPMIVCYTLADDESLGQLTDTVDEFLNSIESVD